jgi:serine/threonine-protein kinase
MGEVYLAQHPRLPRHDALKLLPKEWSADPQYRSRFSREADLASTLWHPNIVGVHDRGEHDGQLWIAMDFVDGQDLSLQLSERYPAGLPADQVIPIVAAVASALDYAHTRGLLHRDVKPANILLTEDEEGDQRVLLADFGIARNLDDVNGLTTTNTTVGTVAYAAPEQLMGEQIDGRADQYALAATAYHLLTGAPLFPNSNPAVVISKHLNSPAPALSDTRADLAELDPALLKALSKSPADRYIRCVDFARALEARTSVDSTARRSSAPTQLALVQRRDAPTSTTAARQAVRRWLIPTIAAAVVILLAGTLLLWRPWSDRNTSDGDPSTPSSLTTPGMSPTRGPMDPFSPPAPSPTSLAPVPATATQPPVENGYALTACFNSNDPPTDRPTTAELLFCASGGLSLQDITWTAWGRDGADGSGIAVFNVCEPSCAEGYRVSNKVVLRAWNPQPASASSGCPSNLLYYTDIIIAFPMSVPPAEARMPPNTRYLGMPALQYSSEPNPTPPAESMGTVSCY